MTTFNDTATPIRRRRLARVAAGVGIAIATLGVVAGPADARIREGQTGPNSEDCHAIQDAWDQVLDEIVALDPKDPDSQINFFLLVNLAEQLEGDWEELCAGHYGDISHQAASPLDHLDLDSPSAPASTGADDVTLPSDLIEQAAPPQAPVGASAQAPAPDVPSTDVDTKPSVEAVEGDRDEADEPSAAVDSRDRGDMPVPSFPDTDEVTFVETAPSPARTAARITVR